MSSLKKLAIRGGMWTIFGYGSSQVLRFGSNVILTRLLVPEMFGLMSLANVFLMGLELFSDVGIAPSIIRHQRGEEPDFYNTAWTIQVLRGFALWIGCLIITYPVSNVYNEPRLLWIIPILGFTTIIKGFNSTGLHLSGRRIQTGKVTRLRIKVQILSLIVMITWAYFDRSIWALIVGNFVNALLLMLWSHQLTDDPPNRFTWDEEAKQDLFTFGKWIFVSTAMTFLASQADRLLLGKLLSLEMLGVYSIAFFMSNVPEQVLKRLSGSIILPVISKLKERPRAELRQQILEKRKFALLASIVGLLILVTCGDVIILLLYDQRYVDASWMLPILALGIWPVVLTQTIDPTLMAIGKPIYGAIGNFSKLVYMIAFIPVAFSTAGVLGAILVIAFNDLPFYLAILVGLWREKLNCIVQDLQATLLLVVLVISTVYIRYILGWGTPLDILLNS